jgi:hypothetical protein
MCQNVNHTRVIVTITFPLNALLQLLLERVGLSLLNKLVREELGPQSQPANVAPA